MDSLLAISVRSFSSIWYWIITGVAWSLVCYVTLGVPYDMLRRAEKRGGAFVHEAEQLARVHVSRIIWVFGTSASRLVTVAIVGFLLAMLATFGFFYRYEIAMAAFTLLAPLVLVQGLGIRLAFVVEAKGLNGAALCSALFRHRFWTQVIALMAIAFSAGIASVSLSRDIAVWH